MLAALRTSPIEIVYRLSPEQKLRLYYAEEKVTKFGERSTFGDVWKVFRYTEEKIVLTFPHHTLNM